MPSTAAPTFAWFMGGVFHGQTLRTSRRRLPSRPLAARGRSKIPLPWEPNLKAETADNVDVLVEHYLNPFGMITAGFFYKNLYRPNCDAELCSNEFPALPSRTDRNVHVTQPINAGSAWIAGFEAAYLQHLTFLPGRRAASASRRTMAIPTRAPADCQGVPITHDFCVMPRTLGTSARPTIAAASPFVSACPTTRPISPVSISGRHAHARRQSFDPDTRRRQRARWRRLLIFSPRNRRAGQHSLGPWPEFVAYGLNLDNEVFGFYQGSTRYMIQREYYKPTMRRASAGRRAREK